ncbi:trypsin-like serine peptidase [Streptomyces albireticuli]
MLVKSGGGQCSASVLASPSGTLIITAAHCVGRKDTYVGEEGRQWTFQLAKNVPSYPYPTTTWESRRAWVPPAFANVGENQFSDIAIIELERDSTGRTIQETARAGLTPELNARAPFRVLTQYGYPGWGSGRQWACRDGQIQRQAASRPDRRGTRLWSPNCALGPGASGGPWADPATMRVLGTTSTSAPRGGSLASDTTGPQFRNLWNRARAEASAAP